MRKVLFLFGLLALCSCGGGSGSGGGGGTSLSNNSCGSIGLNTKIINGTTCSGLGRSPVVRLFSIFADGSAANCTGAVITPTVILTATHCLVPADASVPVAQIIVAAGEKGSATVVEATQYLIHSGFRVEQTGDELNMFNDIALVYVGNPLPVPTLPILVSTTPRAGEVVDIFGYGQSKVGFLPPPATTEEFVNSTIELRSGEMEISSVTNNHLRAIFQKDGSMVCHGDSGGPLIFEVNGQPAIVGVTSQLVLSSRLDCGVGAIAQWTRLQSSEVLDVLLAAVPDASIL